MTVDNEYHPEPRVASIVASHYRPEFVINAKETGKIMMVNYSDLNNLKVTTLDAAKFLHDGGFDSAGRYFLVAANASNKIAVVDTKEDKMAAIVDVGKTPHPNRGANFVHPKFGPVWATSHLGDESISMIGTDPVKHKDRAWKVVDTVKGQGGGSLFIKTHPKSKSTYGLIRHCILTPRSVNRLLYSISTTCKRLCHVTDWEWSGFRRRRKRIVQPEYNQAGDEVSGSLSGARKIKNLPS